MSFFISHIAYADKVLSEFLREKNKKSFIVGTTFPDIRYLGVTERDKTHFECANFDEIYNEQNSFLSGIKFHSLIDSLREKYMQDNVYDLIAGVKDKIRSLKIAEDIILHDKVEDWNQFAQMFNEITPEEKTFLIPEEKLLEWHKIVSNYLGQKLTTKSIVEAAEALSFTEKEAQEYAKDGYRISRKKKVKKLVLRFYNNLGKELT